MNGLGGKLVQVPRVKMLYRINGLGEYIGAQNEWAG